MDEPILTSAKATVTASAATIKGQRFNISDIEEVSSYDERLKARRRALFGGIGVLALLPIAAVTGGGVLPGPIFLIPLFIGGLALLVYELRPTFGTGLIVTMRSGEVTIVKGLSRTEIANIRAAIESMLPTEAPNHPKGT